MTPSSTDEPTSLASRRAALQMPERVEPMYPVAAPEAFDSRDHIFELMWGGLRVFAHVRDGEVRLRGSNGVDLTQQFPEIAALPDRLGAREAILDGELVVLDPDGHPAFDAVRPRLHALAAGELPPDYAKPRKIEGQLCYQAFDLLWVDGRSMLDRPLWQRKNRLHAIVNPAPEFAAVDFVDDEGIAFFEAVVQRKLEGVVAKEKASVYMPGRRSQAWREVRALQSRDVVVAGYTFGGGIRRNEPFSQLLLGAYDDGRLVYIGAVSGGLTDTEAKQLVRLLEERVTDEPPFAVPPKTTRLTYWTEPSLVCRVRFSEWSRSGTMRFPIFSTLRPDIDPAACVAER